MSRRTVSLISAAVIAIPQLAAAKSTSDVFFESFEAGFGEWSAQGYVDPCVPACELEWSVSPTFEQAEDGRVSLDFTVNGLLDDGTVWIERTLALPAGTWNVDLTFHLWDIAEADVGNWDVVAFIDTYDPEFEVDFDHVGKTGAAAGWFPYELDKTITVDEPTIVFVAIGVNVVFETWRTYFIDSVTIDMLPAAASGDLDSDGDVDFNDLLALLAAWGDCAGGCPADLDASGEVAFGDLLILLANWS